MLIPAILTGILYLSMAGHADAQWQRSQDAEILNNSDPTIEWRKFNDEDTGYEVWQMTSSDAGTWATHFNTQSFTHDDRYLVFSSNRQGGWQLYRADLSNGEILQLTDVPSLRNASFTVHPNGEDVYFNYDGKLGRANIYTGEIYSADFEESLTMGRVISNGGKYVSAANREGDRSTIYLISLPDAEIKAKMYWPTGKTQTSSGLTWDGSISTHTMINPAYPWLITFLPSSTHREETSYYDHQRDMSLPKNLRARVWIWDTRTGEVRPFVSMPYHYSNTHEAWGRNGERFFFFQKHAPGWVPNHIASVNRHGRDWQNHHSENAIRLGHGSPSYDGKWFVSDGQDSDRNPIRLINLETGKWEDLAWPDATITGHANQSHPHPSFSYTGNFITYTSDYTGSSEAYVIPIPEELKQELSNAD